MPQLAHNAPVIEVDSPARVPHPDDARRLFPYLCRALDPRPERHISAGDIWLYATARLPGGIIRVLTCNDDRVIVAAIPSVICELRRPYPPPAAAPPPTATSPASPTADAPWDAFLDAMEDRPA